MLAVFLTSELIVNQQLTDEAEQAVSDLAQRHGVSRDAVRTLLHAVSAGGGRMAQFSHPELGGNGQWMLGGMTMVGDMFNNGLKARVSALCQDLANLLASQPVFALEAGASQASAAAGAGKAFTRATAGMGAGGASGAWWPQALGQPSSSGNANDRHYAVFPQARRLALKQGAEIAIYDTLHHQITGVQQHSHGGSGSLTLTSQHGFVELASLPQVNPSPQARQAKEEVPAGPAAKAPAQGAPSSAMTTDQILRALEQLGQLHQQGVLNSAEFETKKAELLAKL